MSEKTKLLPEENDSTLTIDIRDLIVYNDDFNTFDFVIETLIEICNHEYIQAIQCAHLVHNTGKCCVKRGTFKELKPKKDALVERGLSATID